MSNENPNNTPRWRNKLDELEHLPGSAFHGDAAWDKLYGRLQGNRKGKRIFWYWTAAACLLCGLIITILDYQKTTPQVSHQETVKERPKEIKKPVLEVDEASENENKNNVEIKTKTASVANKPVQKNRSVARAELVAKVRSVEPVISYPEKEPLVTPLQIINTNKTTAVVPPKKKLNVVHINELGDPLIESSDVTHIEDLHSFKLKFGNGEVFSNPPVVSKPSGVIILKTKPASN